ncbi:MAG: hypothetical protein Q8868_15535 [Bacteroidota bacterium]|nr:hypothetical protein [Bacteroidota bacterium]
MKNPRKKVCLVAILFISGLQIISGQILTDGGIRQNIERPDSELISELIMNRSFANTEKENYPAIEGDPFLYRDFTPGRVFLKTGEKIPLYLRFNIFTHTIQFRYNEGIFALLNQESVSFVLIDTLRFIYTSYLKSTGDDNSRANTWFLLKKDGKLKFLVMMNLKIQRGESARAYQPPTNTRFVALPDSYYIGPEGKSAIRIESKNDVLSLLADKNAAVMQFMKTNKLGVKKPKDLAKIVNYYNSLQ